MNRLTKAYIALVVVCATLRTFVLNWDPWMPIGLVAFGVYVIWYNKGEIDRMYDTPGLTARGYIHDPDPTGNHTPQRPGERLHYEPRKDRFGMFTTKGADPTPQTETPQRNYDTCPASISGRCLKLTEGYGGCVEPCEYEPDWTPQTKGN